MNIYEIRELVKLLEQTDVESVEVKNETSRLSIKRRTAQASSSTAPIITLVQPQAQPEVAAADAAIKQKNDVQPKAVSRPAEIVSAPSKGTATASVTENLHKITSPMVGTFYRAPAVDAPPYVQVHDRVEESTVVCIVEAMKLFNEIEAEIRGEIVEILVENGQLVEPGQPLFVVKVDA